MSASELTKPLKYVGDEFGRQNHIRYRPLKKAVDVRTSVKDSVEYEHDIVSIIF